MIVRPANMNQEERDPRVLAAMRRHLGRFQKHDCPTCGSKNWNLSAPQTTLGYQAAFAHIPSTVGNGTIIPVVVLICENCFFVRHFAWLPILKEYEHHLESYPEGDGG